MAEPSPAHPRPPRAPSRLDRTWRRSITFTVLLVGLVSVATGADMVLISASVTVSAVGFGFFYLLFAGGGHFGLVIANFLAIYGCVFHFFHEANFPLAARGFMLIALALPVLGFLVACFVLRQSLTWLIRARRLREFDQLPRLSRWLVATLAIGAASFGLPQFGLGPVGQGLALIGTMGLITLFIVLWVHDVVLVMIDVSIVFESVATRLNRLLLPMVAFLTFYALLTIIFASLYRIADMTTASPQFAHNGVPTRVQFVDMLYYSVATITTLGFGDFTPVAPLGRVLTGMEVVCGVLMLLFGFSEIMRSAGPDSRMHEPPQPPARPPDSA